MKKLVALLLALCLCLGLGASVAEGTLWDVYRLELNPTAKTFIQLADYKDDSFVVDVNGNVLSEGYASISVEKDGYIVVDDNGLNVQGFLNGQGQLVMPMQYGDIEWISDRWLAGVVLVEATEEDYDYKSFIGDGYYQIERVDMYYCGALVGSLGREDYYYAEAYGDYLLIRNRNNDRFFYNKALEKSAYEARYSQEYDEDYKTGVIMHCGSNQQAFVPECTLTADEVQTSIWLDSDGVARDLQGNVLFDLGRTYENYFSFEGDYARVRLNDLFGLVDKTGREVLPCEYDEIYSSSADNGGYFDTGYQLVSKGGMVGFVDLQGNALAGFTYSDSIAKTYYQPFAHLQGLDGKYIVISPLGEMTEHYAEVSFDYGCPVFCAKNDAGAAGVVDMAGNAVVPFDGTFDSVYDFTISDDGTLICARVEDGYQVYQLEPVK